MAFQFVPLCWNFVYCLHHCVKLIVIFMVNFLPHLTALFVTFAVLLTKIVWNIFTGCLSFSVSCIPLLYAIIAYCKCFLPLFNDLTNALLNKCVCFKGFVRKVMSVIMLWSHYMSQRARTSWDWWSWKLAYASAVARSATIWRVSRHFRETHFHFPCKPQCSTHWNKGMPSSFVWNHAHCVLWHQGARPPWNCTIWHNHQRQILRGSAQETQTKASLCPAWHHGDWKLHLDNAPAHTTFLVTRFLVDSKVPTVPQPPYSPDVAPADSFVFVLKTSHERKSKRLAPGF